MRKFSIGVGILVGVYFILALVLTCWPEPRFASPPPSLRDVATAGPRQTREYEDRRFALREGARLFARHFPADSEVTIVLVHGVNADSRGYSRSAARLREATGAEVYALDLRGFGQSAGRPGDVDYIGQYEDDLADVSAHIRTEKPEGTLILAGHSIGGGIAQRYAMNASAPPVDAYLLFAPLLGTGSPTVRTEPAEDFTNEGGEPFMKVHVPRIFGLIGFNVLGITALNGLPTLFYNLPPEAPVHEYSFRSMASMAAEPYPAGLEAMQVPLFVAVGSEDEAFHAEQFAPVVGERGIVLVVEGENHDGIHSNEQVIAAIRDWMAAL